MSAIASRQNAKFKIWLSLLESKGIKKHGQAIVSGRKLVEEIQSLHPQICLQTLKSGADLSSLLFKELDVMGTHSPLLVVKVPPVESWNQGEPKGLELIVALSDPGNLGAVLRSAEAFGVPRVILTSEACSPFHPKSIRASAGAVFRLKFAKTGPLEDLQIKNGFGLEMNGHDLEDIQWPKNTFLVLGEEGRGLPASLPLKKVKIPMRGEIESLNATIAASIALYIYRSKNR